MNIIRTQIGALIIEPDIYWDNRGFFMETWNQKRYSEAGIPTSFAQDNLSYSSRGVLRGLHYQHPNEQGKLVYVLQGEVYDVAVDIRSNSPRFGEWAGVNLSSDNRRQFYIPPGFAHGFCVLSETALFAYKCTDIYSSQAEGGIRWDDPDIGIKWPISMPILSEKDRQYPSLKDIPISRLPKMEDPND